MQSMQNNQMPAPCKALFKRVSFFSATIVLALSAALNPTVSAQLVDPEEAVEISTTWSVDAGKPGQQVVLAIPIDVAMGYSIGNVTTQIPDDSEGLVLPSEIKFTLADDTAAELKKSIKIGVPVIRARKATKEENNIKTEKINGQVVGFVPIQLPKEIEPTDLSFNLAVMTQACTDTTCYIPETTKKTLKLKVVSEDTATKGCPDPELFKSWNADRAKKPADKQAGTDYKSKEPPIGPPWVQDLVTAQTMALETGKPIFLYSTKTFCPHCVVVESEMLSSPDLKPYYDRAIWLYVYRDFSGSPTDKKAERIGNRYSLTSWPQLWLVNPHDLATIRATGRTVKSFANAVANVSIEKTDDLSPVEKLKHFETKVLEFESKPSPAFALELLSGDDIVGQLTAVNYFVSTDRKEAITDRAKDLLAIPNDALRYEVLKVIAETGQGNAAEQVAALVTDPKPSRNYNVLRSHAIKALASCGDENSVAVIAPHTKDTARNSTTRVAIAAMIKLNERFPTCKDDVITALADSFPQIEKGVERLVTHHAKLVHDHLQDLTGREIEFPATYDEQTRNKLIKTWSTK